MQQIAVCTMEFDHIETEPVRPLYSFDEGGLHNIHVAPVHHLRSMPAIIVRIGGAADRLPRILISPQWVAPFPGKVARSLSAGVGKLDAHLRLAKFLAEPHDTAQRLLVLVTPQTKILR